MLSAQKFSEVQNEKILVRAVKIRPQIMFLMDLVMTRLIINRKVVTVFQVDEIHTLEYSSTDHDVGDILW